MLRSGEAAKLAGVTSKAIRHYHKLGLLSEPARSENGYRLYSAADLLRLRRIRRLRDLGLPLARIKTVLGEPGDEKSLKNVLETLHGEVSGQIKRLEKRRERIEALLEKDSEDLEDAVESSPTFDLLKRTLAERLHDGLSPETLEQGEKFWALSILSTGLETIGA